MSRRPKTEAQKAQAREYAKKKYWSDPERFRAKASEYGKRRRAADKAAGVKPKRRVLSETEKAAKAERARQAYWQDPEKYRAIAAERARCRRLNAREAVNAAKRALYEKNRDQILEQQRSYRQENREVIRTRVRARLNPVENRARVAEWRAANPDKVRQAKKRRRAREASAPVADFTAAEWEQVLAEFDGKCVYCSARATTQDHLIPLSRGGSHTAANIVPACLSCNCSKGRRTLFEFLEVEFRLFTEIQSGFLVHSWDAANAGDA